MIIDNLERDKLLLEIMGAENLLYVQSAISRERAESFTCPLADVMESVLDKVATRGANEPLQSILVPLFYMILERDDCFGFDISSTYCVVSR